MTEAHTGWLVLLVFSVCSALLAFWLIRNFFIALAASTVIAIVLFQVANYAHVGYLDPFFLIAMVTTTPIAFVIAVVVGLMIRSAQRKERT